MITIPQIVEEIVKKSPFLEEGLSLGIVNHSALARRIKPEIEVKLMKRVQTGAIIMALRRLQASAYSSQVGLLFQKGADMIVRSNLTEFTFSHSDTLTSNYRQLLERAEKSPKSFLTLTQGVFETAVIVSSDLVDAVRKVFKWEKVLGENGNLSSLTLKLPQENVTIPGVYYTILKALAWEGINVADVVSTNSEFTIFFQGGEIDRAFVILKRLFGRE